MIREDIQSLAINISDVESLDLTVIILTFNESKHIERAIKSVESIARQIIVVDSFSSDDTVYKATKAGATVLQNKFINYSKQFQWGLDNAPISSAWIMRLDADEVIEQDLSHEIRRTLLNVSIDIVGINFDRKHIFMGKWIKHGGRYPLRLLRLWRKGHGRIEERWMDEHIVTWGGRTITIKGGFSDINLNDLSFFTAKHNAYATREAIDRLIQQYNLFEKDDAVSTSSSSYQAALKRWFKEKIYNHLPLGVGPTIYFLQRYILQLGFLDGRSGLVYHFLQGYWYRFLVDAKTAEFNVVLAECTSNEDRISKLSFMTGHKLENL